MAAWLIFVSEGSSACSPGLSRQVSRQALQWTSRSRGPRDLEDWRGLQGWRPGRVAGCGPVSGCACCWRLPFKRCLLLGLSCRQRHAESWVFPATCSAAPVIFSDSLTCFSWTQFAEGAVRKKHNLKPKSCMLELSLKSVDENWGGSLKSKLLSEVISPNCSEVYRSSTFAVQTLS